MVGPRKGMVRTEDVRRKIQATKLIQRLEAHIFKGLVLSMSQVRAIEILLRKTIPDLVSTTVTADINVRYVAELPPMLTREEWEAKYGNKQIELTAEPVPMLTNGNGNLQ